MVPPDLFPAILAATRRWLRDDPRGPAWIRAAQRITAPLAHRMPAALQDRALAVQRPGQPLLGPEPPTAGRPENLVESGLLYAGMGVAGIGDVRPAAELVRALTP